MKFRAKPFAYSLALAGLAAVAISTASATALPGGGWIIYYYSNAAHTTIVGESGLLCQYGTFFQSGQLTAYAGPKIQTTCDVPSQPIEGAPVINPPYTQPSD